MRSTDEQLKDILVRSDRMKERKRAKDRVLAFAGSTCLSFVLLALVVSYLPLLGSGSGYSAEGQYGSLILSGPGLGCAVIGILAFVSGICVTLLCFALVTYRKLKD